MDSGMGNKLLFISIFFTLVSFASFNAIAAENTEDTCNYNKSWVFIDTSSAGQSLVSGQVWQVPVEYYLDPSEYIGTTFLYLWGTGPWIDTPDGKYTTERGHIGYPGLSRQVRITRPGRGRQLFTFTVPEGLELVKKNNPIELLAGFRDANGKDWPWRVRGQASFVSRRGYFDIETPVPGNLFTYTESVQLIVKLKNVNQPGQQKMLNYKVFDTTGAVIADGSKSFTAQQEGQEIILELDISQRGIFLIECDVPGWEKRYTTFGRIPDLSEITRDGPTGFGLTTHYNAPNEKVWAIARRLGLTNCRRFTRWYTLQPGPDFYNLEDLEKELETANQYGIKIWLCITDPPPFAFSGKAQTVNYEVFNCNWDFWQNFVQTVTTQLKGKLYGWEWLNEILPGDSEDPVGTYLTMCRLGSQTAKAIDPNIVSILAGGLYPRSFRNQLLTAGVGNYIDALPVHYQNGDGIIEARMDLDSAGCKNVAVWEDESAKGLNSWNVPPIEELENTDQCNWVLNQWTDELVAGAEKIIYFGGEPATTGGYSYLLDDFSPRPVAATIGVFTSKMIRAKPLGVFLLGQGGLFHLFERDGKPILVASTYEQNGEKIRLQVGTEKVLVTDYQGNENYLLAPASQVELQLNPLRCFIEKGDLDVLKAYVVPQIIVSHSGAGTSSNVATARQIIPHVSMLKGTQGKLSVQVRNLYDRDLSGNINVVLPTDWPGVEPEPFRLQPSQEIIHQIELEIPKDINDKDYSARIEFNFDWDKLPQIDKPVVLSVISPQSLGNLMPNGDFEMPDATGKGPEGWVVNSRTKIWTAPDGLDEGLGEHVLKFENTSGWEYVSRTIGLRGGQTYLYTAWVRNENIGTGSNMTQILADGSQKRLYDVQVFTCGTYNPYWQMFTCRKQMPADTKQVSFTPVANGKGWATWDNIRVTVFEGTDYAAEAYKVKNPPKIDGSLDEWVKKCPIPLIGNNQIPEQADTYAWSPENLSAVGYLMWDDDNLYAAFQVRDNVHFTTGSGQADAEAFIKGDSLILGIDPTHRGPDADSKAFAYYLSSEAPGGGSGIHTILRPSQYSGGRESGHLFQDSSIYDMAVTYSQDFCIYELRIPLTEIGVQASLGTKIGLSIQLNDNDGRGLEAQMNWGEGLFGEWSPNNFGVVTFVE
jgi:hypothetical protein